MKELNFDLKKECWDKLDFSEVINRDLLDLYNRPIMYTNDEFEEEENLHYGFSLYYEDKEGNMVFICHSNEEFGKERTQFGRLFSNNRLLLNNIFQTDIIIYRGLPISMKDNESMFMNLSY